MRGHGRVRPKKGIDHVRARRSVRATGSANASETEIGFRGAMGQGVVVVRGAEIVGSITHMRVVIGRWQKEWDFDCFCFSFCILDGT